MQTWLVHMRSPLRLARELDLDVLLLERSELTSGSSWHAAGQIHTISSDPNISRLQGYTINLYKEIEALSGHSIGLHTTGGFYLASNRVWYDYLKRERSKARTMGLDQEFISVEEVARRHPLINPRHYLAALWDPIDGDIDASGVVYAYAKAARALGAQYLTHTPVTATRQRSDGSWDVHTPRGIVPARLAGTARLTLHRAGASRVPTTLAALESRAGPHPLRWFGRSSIASCRRLRRPWCGIQARRPWFRLLIGGRTPLAGHALRTETRGVRRDPALIRPSRVTAPPEPSPVPARGSESAGGCFPRNSDCARLIRTPRTRRGRSQMSDRTARNP